MDTLKFKNDGLLRKRLMVPEGMSHPAKGHLGLWETIIQKYTRPGDTILDPMAGVGSTLLAALMGRNSLKTEIVVTANLREWRYILRLRTASRAHPQMREVMLMLLKQLRHDLPVLFEDIPI